MFCNILLCEGQKSYVMEDFAKRRTKKLCFAMFCYNKDRKAEFCNILRCDEPKNYFMQDFAMCRTKKLCFAIIRTKKLIFAIFC